MIPESVIALIKEFEGLQLNAYLCPAGVWTVGYGVTRINGRPVRKGDKLASEKDAAGLLALQLQSEYLPALEKIPNWGIMSDGQRAALISFAWNLGAYFYGSNGFGTITRELKEGNWAAVPKALRLYNKANGQTMAGLVRRREAEAKLWQEGLNQTPSNQPSNSEKKTMIHYFLDFVMGLDNDGRLEDGRLILRHISESGGCTREIWIATSSVANKQKPEDFHQKGGPIPPEYRVPAIKNKSWEVETTPTPMPNVKGVEGNFYKILPFLVKTDENGERGDFGVHRDANVPGSAGCVVMSAERFSLFEKEMKRLRDLGYMKLPLFISYPTN